MPSSTDLICLLDDEPSILRAVGRLLASEGLSVREFGESALLLAYARENPVRLAIVDICLPGMSGLEVLRRLRQDSPAIQVILMTGQDTVNARAAAQAGGAYAFFAKPFDHDQFLAAVHAALAQPHSGE